MADLIDFSLSFWMDDLFALRSQSPSINEFNDYNQIDNEEANTSSRIRTAFTKPFEATFHLASNIAKKSANFIDGGNFDDAQDSDDDHDDPTERLVQTAKMPRAVSLQLPPSKYVDPNIRKKTKKRLKSLFHPYSFRRSIWYILVALVALYNVVSIPLRLGFRRLWFDDQTNFALCIVDYIGDLLCLLDILLLFLTPYLSQGEWIHNPKLTALNYAKTLLSFDLICTLPFDLFVWGSVWKHCLARLPRMLRFVRIPGYFENLERKSSRPYLYTLIKILGAAICINHIFACGYFAVAYHEGFGSTRFVPPLETEDLPLSRQYLIGYWWSTNVITRVGGSPQPPITSLEQGIMMIVAFFTLFFVAFVIGGVSEAINRLGEAQYRFRRKVDAINTFMRNKQIPNKVRERVNQYFDHLWARRAGEDDSTILRDLPSHLRNEISLLINGEIVPKVPFFSNCSAGFIKSIVSHLKPHIYSPGDWIVKVGDAGSEMYFISRGDVVVTAPNGETLSVLSEGDFFGEICLLIDTQRTASARAATYCDVFVLEKRDLSTVLENFPEERPLLQELAETRIGHDFLRNMIYRDTFFKDCNHDFLNYCSDAFKFKRFESGQYIYKYGDTTDAESLFFIASGTMEILSPAGKHISQLTEGSFFGHLELLSQIPQTLESVGIIHDDINMAQLEKRNVSLRSCSNVTIVFVLRKKDLFAIFDNPKFKNQAVILRQAARNAWSRAKDSMDSIDSLSEASIRAKYNFTGDSNVSSNIKRGMLQKKMSAFLQTPLEAAKENIKTKQRLASLEMERGSTKNTHSSRVTVSSKKAQNSSSTESRDSLSRIEAFIIKAVNDSSAAVSDLTNNEKMLLLKTISKLQVEILDSPLNFNAED